MGATNYRVLPSVESQVYPSIHIVLYIQIFQVMSHADDVMATAAALSRLDVATSLGLLARERVYILFPDLSTTPSISTLLSSILLNISFS